MTDLRFALRQLRKNPGYTAVAVLTLALGIGATTAVFSAVNAVLFRPLPYRTAEQLVIVGESNARRGIQQMIVRPATFFDWRTQAATFAGFAAECYESFNVTGGVNSDHVHASRVTANYFELLGVEPQFGRGFAAGDDLAGNANVVILSHGFWQRQFASDAEVLGKVLRLNGEAHTVVGVMPSTFRSFNPTTVRGRPTGAMEPELWTPYPFTAEERQNRHWPFFLVLGRLREGVTLDQAQADLTTVAARLAQIHPMQRDWGARLTPLHGELVGGVRGALLKLLGAVGFVLLIACANVANLILARSLGRRKEFAVRAALGAGWSQTTRLLLTEALTLTALGASAGLAVALGLMPLISRFAPPGVLRLEDASLDARVLLFTLAASTLSACVCGLAPLAPLRQASLAVSLDESSRSASSGRAVGRMRGGLVVSQVALALVLLMGAGLFIRSFRQLAAVNPGFQPEQLLALDFTLPDPRYGEESRRIGLLSRLLERVEELPGVRSAATVHGLPFSTMLNSESAVSIEGRGGDLAERERILAGRRQASPRYFETMGIPVLHGRAFSDTDDIRAPRVVLVNESFVRTYLYRTDPVGKRVAFGVTSTNWCEIVGVVQDVKLTSLDAPSRPEIYQPHRQSALWMFSVVVRAEGHTEGLAKAVAEAALALDRDLPAYNPRLLDAEVARSLGPRRFGLGLLAAFSALALLLAAAGIYGVMSFVVGQRHRELGIRMALGARRHDVLLLILRQGGRLVGTGSVLGLVGILALQPVLADQLFAVGGTDPLTMGIVSALLLLVALLACWIPAHRAAKSDPMVALRSE